MLVVQLLSLASLVISLVALAVAIRSHRIVGRLLRAPSAELSPEPEPRLPISVPEAPPAEPARPEPRRHAPASFAGPTLINVPDLSFTASTAPATSDDLAQRFGSIWSLSDEGRSPEAIAATSGLPVGQVELILGLRRPRAAEPRS